ncbi:putative leucine-rich repeat-containing protein DDB_G0290503 [Heterodontus francisci]
MSVKRFQATQLEPQLTSQQHVSKCFDVMVLSQVNWEMFLLPTTTSVAILGELVHQTARVKVIKRNQSNADKKSQFRIPESFWSCLMEVCTGTVNSFQETRNNLDQIQMYCELLTKQVKNVGEGLVQNKDFPKLQENIQKCAADCTNKAETVVKELSSLSELFSELLENCEASQIASQDKLGEVRKILEETQQRNESIEKEKRDLENEWIEVSQKREALNNEYADVSSSTLIDQFCVEELEQLKNLLPKIVDLFSNVTNPVNLAVELGKGLMFLVRLVSELSSKESSESNAEVSNLLKTVREQAELKIKEVQDKLQESQNNYNECLQKMKCLGDESEKLLREMTDNQAQEKDISTSMELMVKGLGALGSIKSNWSQMLNFILMIPRITEDCQKIFERLGAGNDGATQGIPGMLSNGQFQVSQAVRIMSLIGDMIKTYVEIYDNYLKDPLRDMGRLLSEQGTERKFKQIQKKCLKARAEIQRRITENQEVFNKNGSEVIGKLTNLMDPRK